MRTSIEFCHIDPRVSIKKAIDEANEWLPKAVGNYKADDIALGIMIDDVHTDYKVDQDFIDKCLSHLQIKPHAIYLESSFIPHARYLMQKIEAGQDRKSENELQLIKSVSTRRMWAREKSKKYHYESEFLVAFPSDKDSEIAYTCPVLAAASYLYRLGLIPAEVGKIQTVYGEDLGPADRLLNVLSSYYLQIEDRAQTIVQAADDSALRSIGWYFY